MGDYPQFPAAVPLRGVGCRRLTHPFATPPRGVRLACLIHAANVHSEPGSNPSKSCGTPPKRPPADTPRTSPSGRISRRHPPIERAPRRAPSGHAGSSLATRPRPVGRSLPIAFAAGGPGGDPSPAPLAGTPADLIPPSAGPRIDTSAETRRLMILAETEQRLAHTRLPPPSPPGDRRAGPPVRPARDTVADAASRSAGEADCV